MSRRPAVEVPDQDGCRARLRVDSDRRQSRSVRREPAGNGPVGCGVERRRVPLRRVDHGSCFSERVPVFPLARTSCRSGKQVLDQVVAEYVRQCGDVAWQDVHSCFVGPVHTLVNAARTPIRPGTGRAQAAKRCSWTRGSESPQVSGLSASRSGPNPWTHVGTVFEPTTSRDADEARTRPERPAITTAVSPKCPSGC